MDAHEEERCLVCNLKSVDDIPLHNLTDPFPHNEDLEILRSRVGLTTNVALNQQLSVIFLLRKVLRLNQSVLEGVLQSTGSNPSTWNLRLCRVCYRTFEEADFVFSRLRKLHKEFAGLCHVLCKKVVGSVEICKDAPRVKLERKRKRGKRESLQAPPDLDDYSSSVADQIRNALYKQAHEENLLESYNYEESTLPLEKTSVRLTPSPAPPILKSPLKVEGGSKRRRNLRVQFAELEKSDLNQETSERSDDQQQHDEPNEYVNDDVVGENDNDDNNSDMEFTPNFDSNDEDDGGEIRENENTGNDSDSDFEVPVNSSRRRTANRKIGSRKRNKKQKTENNGLVLKAVKMENAPTYSCPKCQEVFESASLCDHHILHNHYGGKWPKNFSCHVCEDVSFKGEHWLRHHYKMRHPGVKWSVDETIERSIHEGIMPELTYEVIPVGQSMSFLDNSTDVHQNETSEDSSLFNRTLPEAPANAFSIPVVQGNGQIHYLVLPNCVKRLPAVLPVIQPDIDGKPCRHCDKKYPTELQLQAHINRAHKGDNLAYQCPICPKKFERIGKTLLHVQQVHILSKFACEMCGNTFKEEIYLKAHIQRNHFGIEHPYKCIKCSIRYPRRSSLNHHLKKVHKLQIAAKALPAKQKKKKPSSNLIKRVRSKNKILLEKKFSCRTCFETGQLEVKFVTEEELDTHMKRRHMGIPRPYSCPICDKKYSTPAKVEGHMKIHTVRSDLHIDDIAEVEAVPMPFVCTPCDKQFRTRTQYASHLKGRYHEGLKPFVCEMCSQRFVQLKYLQNHQFLKHHKELNVEPFKCKFCNQVLGSERTLNDHIKVRHTKNARYTCPYCDVLFQHASARDQHINALHTKSQQFLCPKCPKSFLRDFYLKNHMMRVHCEKKPYECKYCFKTFSDKPTFNRHVEAHSDVVHECPHCGKSGFKTRHALRVHRRTFHKEELDELERQKKLEAYVPPHMAETTTDNTLNATITENNESQSIEVMEVDKVESQHVGLENDLQDGTTSLASNSASLFL